MANKNGESNMLGYRNLNIKSSVQYCNHNSFNKEFMEDC